LLVPFALTFPFLINNFELLQINMILFVLALWGVFPAGEREGSRGRDRPGGGRGDESHGHRFPSVFVVQETVARSVLDGGGHTGFFH
jgi:hypothetical protein